MSWLLASGLIAALGVIATLTAALWYFARRALQRSDSRGELAVQLANTDARLTAIVAERTQLQFVMDSLSERLGREVAARKAVERQRDQALKNLAEHGDPDGIAAVINSDLERLRALSEEEVSEVPAAGDHDRNGAGAVHGTAGPGDRADGG